MSTNEIVPNIHQTNGTDLIPRLSPIELHITNSRRKAPTSYRDDRHYPTPRITGTYLAPGQKALTSYWDIRHRLHTGTTGTDLIL
jgi:hypothetical protein